MNAVARSFVAFVVFLALSTPSLSAYAQTSSSNGLVYHGRIVKANHLPLEEAGLRFVISVYGRNLVQNKRCLLFQEEQNNIDLTGSSGVFELRIGEGNRLMPATLPGGLSRVFLNSLSYTQNNVTCDDGSTSYVADVLDRDREIEVAITTSTGVLNLPPQKIRSVPWALQAMEIGGYSADYLLKLDQPMTQQFPAVAAQFLRTSVEVSGGVATGRLLNITNPVNPSDVANKAYVDSVVAGSVVAGQGISVTGSTVSTKIDGSTIEFDGSGIMRVRDAGISSAKLANGAVTFAKIAGGGCAAGTVMTFDGAAWGCSAPNAETDPTVPAWAKNANLLAADVPNLDASKITTGILPVARGGTNSSSFAGNKIIVSNATGNTLTAFSCAVGETIKFDAGGLVGCYPDSGLTSESDPTVLAFAKNAPNATHFETTGNVLNLTNTGVTAGTYPKVTVDGKGRVTGGQALAATDIPDISANYIAVGASAGGDLTGTYPSPTLAQKGATTGQVLKWNGSAWAPAADTDTDTGITSVVGQSLTQHSVWLGNASNQAAVVTLPSCAAGQVLKYNNSTGFTCENDAGASGTVASIASSAPVKINGGTAAQTGAVTVSVDDATTSAKGVVQVGTGLNVASGTVSVAYGTTAGTAVVGNDARLSDARTPTGAAGGALAGTYPNPTLAQNGATTGQVLKWNGSAWTPAADTDTGITSETDPTVPAWAKNANLLATDVPSLDASKITTGVLPVARGGTNSSSFAGNKIIVSNTTGNTLTAFSCAVGETIKFDAGGLVGCYPDSGLTSETDPNVQAWAKVAPGADFDTTGNILNLTNSGVVAGTYPKVTVDGKGRVTGGQALAATDIPDISADYVAVGASAGGDLAGTYPSPTLAQKGATSGQVLKWNGSAWAPAADTDTNTTYTAGNGLSELAGAFDVNVDGASLEINADTLRVKDSGITSAKIADGTIVNADVSATANIDATKLGTGVVSNTELNYLDGVTSSVQTQLNSKISSVAGQSLTQNSIWMGDASNQAAAIAIPTCGASQYLTFNGTTWSCAADAGAGGGLTSLNTLTAASQTFATGTTGTDFAISSAGSVHTFNLPTASTTNRGALSSADWTTFNNKLGTATTFSGDVSGAYNATSVDKIKGKTVSAATAVNQLMIYDGTNWVNNVVSGDATLLSTGVLTISNNAIGSNEITDGSIANADIANVDWSKITTGKPTTLSGYGITDAVSNGGGTPSMTTGTLAARPAFGTAGRIYIASDTNAIYRDTGSAWVLIGDGTGSTTLAGDVTGTLDANTVAKIRGVNVTATAPTNGQVLKFNGTDWAPAADTDTNTTYSASAPLTLTAGAFGLEACANGEVLKYNGTAWVCSTDATGGTPADATTSSKGIMQVGTGLGVAAGVVSVTYGTTAGTAVVGNDARLSDARAPTGAAGGDLAGTYPNPTIAQKGATSGQVLKWNGSAWAPAADTDTDTNTTYTAGNGLSELAGAFDVNVDGATLEINADTLRVKDAGITSTKIADGTIVNADIANVDWAKITTGKPTTLAGYGITDSVTNGGGTPSITTGMLAARPAFGTAGRIFIASDTNAIYRDTGTAWVLIGDGTGAGGDITDVIAGNGLTGGAASGAATVDVSVDNVGIEINTDALRLKDLGVTSAKIADGAISAAKLNQMAATSGQVLKWNGSAWAPAADAGITAETDPTVTAWAKAAPAARMITTGNVLDFANSGVTAGTYKSVTVDVYGRVTAGTNPTTLSGYGITDSVTNAGGTPSVQSGTLAARPAFGTTGRIYIASDTNEIFRDTGSAWAELGDGGISAVAGQTLTQNSIWMGNASNQAAAIAIPTCAAGNYLTYNGTAWSCSPDTTGGTPADATTSSKGIMQVGTGLGVTAGVVSVTYGTTAGTAVVGNDSRLSDARAPTGAAGGDLAGTYPNPTIAQKGATSGQVLKWNGSAWAPAADAGITAESDPTVTAWAKAAPAARMITTGNVLDLANSGVTAGTYKSVTVDVYGRVTAGTNPTTLSGYGITDSVANAGGTPSVQSGTLAARPAFGTAGRIYIASDTNEIFRDTGSAWAELGDGAGSGDLTDVTASAPLSVSNSSGPNPNVSISNGTTAGQTLRWNGTNWVAAQLSSADITLTGNISIAGDVVGNLSGSTVAKIRGVNVSGTAPTNGQVLKYNGTDWIPSSDSGLTSETDPTVAAWSKVAPASRLVTTGNILDLASVGTSGTYKSVTVDAYGRVTAGTNPTTLSGYGITDAISNGGGTPSITTGTFAARPAFGTAGRLYVASDTNQLFRDTGSAWVLIGDGTAGSYTFSSPLSESAGTVSLGTVPVNKGGTGATSFTANKVIVSNGTGSALSAFSCSVGEVIGFDASGVVGCYADQGATGSGTANRMAKWTSATALGNGGISDSSDAVAVTIDASENVGIGTTPSAKLHIASGAGATSTSTILATSTNNSMMFIPQISGGSYNPMSTANDSAIIAHGGAQDTGGLYLGIWSASAKGIRIVGSSGDVGIGTASPAYKLDVNGIANATQLCIAGTCKSAWDTGFTGSGTANRVVKWTAANGFGNSGISDSADAVAISIDVNENINLAGNIAVKDAATSTSVAINSANTISADVNRYGIQNLLTLDATTNLTASRTHYGAYNDVRSTLTDTNLGAFANTLYGSYNRALAGLTAGTAGGVTTMAGAYNYALNQSNNTTTVANHYGSYNYANITGTGATTNLYGVQSLATNNNAGSTVGSMYGVNTTVTNTAGTVTNGYLFKGNFSGAAMGTEWGLHLTGETKNYMSGSLGIGTTTPAHKLDVSGNVNATQLCIGGVCKSAWDGGTVTGTGTANRIAKFTAAGVIDDSSVTDTGTNVSFMVNRADDTTYEWVGFNSGATRQGIFLWDGVWSGCMNVADEFCLRSENGNHLTLAADTGKDVRIGHSGAAQLVVNSAGDTLMSGQAQVGASYGSHISGTGSGAGMFGSNMYVSGSSMYTKYGHASYGYSAMKPAWGSIYFYAQGGATTADTAVTPSPRMTITSTGGVGIGTSAPSYALDVTGDIRASGEVISTNSNQFRMVQGNYGTFWRNDGNDLYLLMTASGSPYGSWNSLRPFTIDIPTGNVSVGGGSLSVVHGGDTTVAGQLKANGWVRSQTSGQGWYHEVHAGGWYMSDNSWIRSYNDKGLWMGAGTLGTNGSLGVGTSAPAYKADIVGAVRASAYYFTSDQRLKKNIESINGLEMVLKMRGVKFDWIKTGEGDIGLIAQEVEKVAPELVSTDPNGFKSVKYGNIVAPLIEATKALAGKYENMNNDILLHADKLSSVERRVASLEEKLAEKDAQLKKQQSEIDLMKKQIEAIMKKVGNK